MAPNLDDDPLFAGVRSALARLTLPELDLLIVENVGNLVCPAEFQVGEHHRAMV